MAADRHAATIEELLVAVASADRHEDSPERKVAWDEIKRREAERVMLKALLGGGRAPTDEEVAYFRRLMDSTDRSDAATEFEGMERVEPFVCGEGHEWPQLARWENGAWTPVDPGCPICAEAESDA